MAKKDNLGAYNIEDLRLMAKKKLPRGIFGFIDGGAEDHIAVQNNRDAYTQLKIKNRVLIDVSKRSTETTIFGKKIAMPYGISPTGSAGLARYGGEIGLAEAAAEMNVPCTVATNALTLMEEIWEKATKNGGGNLWFQLYMWADKEMSKKFMDKVKAVGFETLIVTVDGPVHSQSGIQLQKRLCHAAQVFTDHDRPIAGETRLVAQCARPAIHQVWHTEEGKLPTGIGA